MYYVEVCVCVCARHDRQDKRRISPERFLKEEEDDDDDDGVIPAAAAAAAAVS